jgi:FtsP/CotA-like multicopper oxidase with cupredoxin domain
MLTRRQFAVGSATIIGAGVLGSSQAGKADALDFHTPLPIPKLIDAAKEGNSVKLKAASSRHSFFNAKPAPTYGYSASLLGPVIRLRRGDEVEMVVENMLGCDTTVHWHGLAVPGASDGGPHQVVRPGESWRPVLKIDQPASTAWYHPHAHHDIARQVYMGLAGLIIVDDGSDSLHNLPRTYGIDDLPIILQDRSFAPDGSLVYSPSPLSVTYGSRGDTIIVNGVVGPVARVPRGLVRLRILDGANARNFYLRFSDRRTFHVIASDSGMLGRPVAVRQLRISPGERFEILVDFADRRAVTLETGPDEELGAFGAMAERRIDGEYEPVMRFEPTGTHPAVKDLPARLVEPAAADPARAVRRRQFILDSGMCMPPDQGDEMHMGADRVMCINGKSHDPARIDESVEIGTTEIWEVFSLGMAHPFHIHGASFRILSISDAPPPAHLMGWKDVVLVEEKAELLVAFNRSATTQCPFMYHCHILEHEDAGMMGQYVCI